MFRIGQKVVCVDDGGFIIGDGWKYPVKNGIYTVAGFGINTNGKRGLLLDEIENIYKGKSIPFYRWRFRPVIERKTDISIFTAMLNSPHVTEKV